MDIELKDLEKASVNLTPESIFMEGDTVLVQYIIQKWSLHIRNESKTYILCLSVKLIFILLRRI